MMPQRLKSSNELPKWFDLKNYEPSLTMSAEMWLHNLEARECLYHLARVDAISPTISATKDVANAYSRIQESPLLDIQTCKTLPHLGWAISDDIDKAAGYGVGVRPATLEDFDFIQTVLSDDSKALLEKGDFDYKMTLPDKTPYQATNHFLRDCLTHTFDGSFAFTVDPPELVRINLDLPDGNLEAQFKSYLKQIRKQSSRAAKAKGKHSISFADWVTYGVLPYIDLKIWQMVEDKEIVARVMAEAIYSSPEYTERTIHTVTAKYALHALSKQGRAAIMLKVEEEIQQKI
jgi:hypothetical protein